MPREDERKVCVKGLHREIRRQRDDRVKEHLAGEELRVIVLQHRFEHGAVKRPAQCRSDREQVAHRADLERKDAVHDHRHDARERDEASEPEARRHAEVTPDHHPDEHSENRRRRDEHRHVAGLRVGKRRVFREKVGRAAQNAQQDHDAFVLPAFREERPRQDEKHRQPRDDRSIEQNVGGRQARQQKNFCIDERDAPDYDHEEADGVRGLRGELRQSHGDAPKRCKVGKRSILCLFFELSSQ